MQTQQHSFNMPFQLACPGPEQYSDTSESATVYELELEPGDVVVLATDGVLDNLWDDQIAEIVTKALGVSIADTWAADWPFLCIMQLLGRPLPAAMPFSWSLLKLCC